MTTLAAIALGSVAPTANGPVSPAALAEIGALIGDSGRASMLIALLDGRALTARELADCAGVTPQTASSHLAKLVAAGLIRMEKSGRRHYHQLAGGEVAHMLETMYGAGAVAARSRRTGPADAAMRVARTCYDHMAGRLAVDLAEALRAAGHVELDLAAAAVTPSGVAFLDSWGVACAPSARGGRPLCRACLDWSERRPHLAGRIGAAILDRSLSLGWVRRRPGTRALTVTPAGQLGFARQFAVAVRG